MSGSKSGSDPDLLTLHVGRVLLIFEAGVAQEFCIGQEGVSQLNGPWGRIGLGIVNSDFDFKLSKANAPESFGYFSGVRERTAVAVQPKTIRETGRLYDKSVALPLSHGVTINYRLVDLRQSPAVCEYLTVGRIGF